MATIDTLTIQFSTTKAKDAVTNIKDMATAVRNLASGLQGIETGKLDSFAQAMGVLKANTPTSGQATNMKEFAAGVSQLATAINGTNLSGFANDISNISNGAQGLGARTTNKIVGLVSGLTQVGQQAQAVANTVQNASNKISANSSNTSAPSLNSTNDVVASLDKIASRVDKIKSKFKGVIVPTKQFKSLEEEIDKVAREYDKLREKMQSALNSGDVTVDSSKYQGWQRELEGIRNEYDRLILKQKELTLEGGAIKINPTLTTTLKAFGQGFSYVTNIVKNGFNAAIKTASRHIKSFVSHAKSAASSLKKTATSGLKTTDMAKKLSKELFRVAKMLKLMITRMALRKVIEEVGNGFKSLALHCKTFDDNVSNLINSSKKLGYSFASMLEPLINALAPALLYIIELITRAVNALNQLFSALGGGTVWHKAKDFTRSWSDSIKEANKNAKELKKTVLGFDELNQLTDNKNSGSGSGGITDMFEDVPIDPKWMDFAKWLKDMWAKGDFYDLGKLWGERLRDFLESIPWDEIQDTANKLGKSLASLINGFVEVEKLGYDIGYTIAQAFNTVFEFVNGFVHELHWDSIGTFIAETFNGFFESINWGLIKDTVITALAGLADSITAFVKDFNWDNISNFVTNGVNIIIHGINTFFRRVSWKELGQNLGEQLQKTIEGIHWKELGETIGRILQSAIDFVSSFVHQLKVDDIRAKLKEMVDSFFDTVDTQELGMVLADIIDLVVQIAAGFWNDNKERLWEEGNKLVRSFFDNLDDDTKGYIENAISTVLQVAVTAGIAKAMTALAGEVLIKGFGKYLAGLLFGGAGAGAAGAGAAGAAGASGEMIGAATVAGSTIGTTFAYALVGAATAIVSYDLANHIAKWVASARGDKELAELYDQYSGISGGLRLVKDTIVTLGEEYSQFWYNIRMKLTKDNDEIKTSTESVIPAYQNVAKEVDSATKIYKNHTEVLEDIKKGHDNVLGSYKTHWDIVNKTKDAVQKNTEKNKEYNTSNSEVVEAIKSLEDTMKELSDKYVGIKASQEKVVDYNTIFKSSMGDMQTTMKDTGKVADETGKQIVEGIKKPINDAKFDKETRNMFNTLYKDTENVFGIHSPAKNMMPIGENIILGVNEGMESTFDTFNRTFSTFYDNYVRTWFDKSKWSFSGVADGLRKTFEDAKDSVRSVWNSIADRLNGEHEIGSSSIRIDLPKFASGGFVEDGMFYANRHELVGDFGNGKTAVANNSMIVSGIERGVYNAVSRAMSSNNGNNKYIVTEMYIDSEKAGRFISKGQEKANRRYNPSMV